MRAPEESDIEVRSLGSAPGVRRPKVRATAFQADDDRFESGRTLQFSPVILAASTQGERARLLTGNEPGSIPGLPANTRASDVTAA